MVAPMLLGAWRVAVLAALAASMLAPGCVYPRRATSLVPVRGATTVAIGAPTGVVSLTIVAARTPASRRGGMAWDDGGGAPDCFVRVFRNETMVYESPTVADNSSPRFDAHLPESLVVSGGPRMRLELWDRDTLGSDPVGVWRGVGLPGHGTGDGETRVLLDGGTYLTIRTGPPRPYRGIGIRLFELRPGELYVVEVEPYSPAGRAGIVAGDRIVAIGGRLVGSLSAAAASGALSMAADRHQALRLRNSRGGERVVELDRGYTYLVD